MEHTAPSPIITPFAANGEKNTIPQTVTDQSSNQASYNAGFPSVTMVPRVSGGKPPQGKDFNGILFDITSNVHYMNAGGVARFNQELCDAIGGYPLGAVLQSEAGTELFLSTANDNTNNPNEDSTNWKTIVGGSSDEDHWRIGVEHPMTSTVLPEGYMWCDRSLALFADYPKFHQKYLNGGFEGMVLPADSDDETIENNPRKFVLSLDNLGVPNGLYVYGIEGLFPRHSTSENAGARNSAGLPNIVGSANGISREHSGNISSNGSLLANKGTTTDNAGYTATAGNYLSLSIDASLSNTIYGNSDTVMVDSYNAPVAIYLGAN